MFDHNITFSCSVRVSNELGAGNPKAAKFSIVVTVWTSLMFGTLFTAVILGTKNNYPSLFTSEPLVMSEASKLGYFLAATIFLNSIQPILHGTLSSDVHALCPNVQKLGTKATL